MIANVKDRVSRDAKWKSGFILNPQTYLNQERWNDDIKAEKPKQSGYEKPDVQSQSFKKWDGKESEVIGPTHDQYGDMK